MDEQVTETAGELYSPTDSGDTDKGRQQRRALVRRLHKMVKRSRTAEKRYKKKCAEGLDFYFGEQWDEKAAQAVRDRGQEPVVVNRVKPTTKLVHGLMVARPVDWSAKPVGKQDDQLAEIGTASLKFVSNTMGYTHLRSRAYWWSLVYGLGVVMLGLFVKDQDPRREAVQGRVVDPREIGWDPQSRELDWSDARYLRWTRKVDLKDAQGQYRNYAHLLARLAQDCKDATDNTDAIETWEGSPWYSTPPVKDWKNLDDWNQADQEDGSETPQVTLHEVWEKVNEPTMLAEFPDGTVEIDPAIEADAKLLTRPDLIRYYEAEVPKVYYHVLCGPLLLKSGPSPYKHGRFPFVPVWHERDHHGDPVSFVEGMKSVQREINYRRSKMLHQMINPNIRVSERALNAMDLDRDGFAEVWAKGGGVLIGDAGDFEVMAQPDIVAGQFQLMQDSKGEIQAMSGANDDLMGYDSSSKSGVAKQTQMQQGATMQRPNEDNLRLFDKAAGEIAFQLIQQAHGDEWTVRVTDNIGHDQYYKLNQRSVDPETGRTHVTNDIANAQYEIEISTAPWSPTIRQETSQMLSQMAANEQEPIVRATLNRAAVMVSDMPEKAGVLQILDEGIQRMTQQMGGGQPDPAAMEAQQRAMAAEVAGKEADAAKKGAEAEGQQMENMARMQAMEHNDARLVMEADGAQHGRMMAEQQAQAKMGAM